MEAVLFLIVICFLVPLWGIYLYIYGFNKKFIKSILISLLPILAPLIYILIFYFWKWTRRQQMDKVNSTHQPKHTRCQQKNKRWNRLPRFALAHPRPSGSPLAIRSCPPPGEQDSRLWTQPMEAKFAYLKLNSQTACPPRTAVPVNQAMFLEILHSQHPVRLRSWLRPIQLCPPKGSNKLAPLSKQTRMAVARKSFLQVRWLVWFFRLSQGEWPAFPERILLRPGSVQQLRS